MNVQRSGPKGLRCAPFGLALLGSVLMPSAIGFQDLGAPAAAAAGAVPQRERSPMIASPFGTIHGAMYTFPRPIGTGIPEPSRIRLASLNTTELDVTGSLGERAVRSRRETPADAPLAYPTVNRALKGDFLAARSADEPVVEARPAAPAGPASPSDDEIEAALRFVPFPEYDISLSLELHPQIPGEEPEIHVTEAEQPDISLLVAANDPDARARTARVYFGDLIGSSVAGIVPWMPGEEPILMLPRAPDTDLKRSAVAKLPDSAMVDPDEPGGPGGETVAGKGQVTGDGRRPKTPAERLGLAGPAREKAEKCLANAVYFESRGEAVRGQIGVAQVVLNRAFSGYYPNDVCGVVYQNAHRHLACQFTFACDGITDVISEADAWERAKNVAKATLDGRVWLPEIGKATHYHAYWVNPWWVRTMRKLTKLGVHTFYRPRRWGDGDEAPSWGTAEVTAATTPKL
jgi:spore germination cell wall hydrolase CwlJ-like protein